MRQTLSKKLSLVPDAVWLAAIILVGFALRLIRLGDQSLWNDEAFSWLLSTLPLDEGLEWMRTDFVHPPLYYWILHLVSRFGQGEFMLRLPSAVAGLVSIPLMYQVGRAMPGTESKARAVGLLAAALLAINPFHLWFSREARSYQLIFLLALLLLYLFHFLLRHRKYWLSFTIASAFAYVTHYFAVFLAAVQFIYILLGFRQHYRFFRRWVLAQALAFVPLAIWMADLYVRGIVGAGIGWIPRVAPLAPLLTLWNFALLTVGRVAWWDILVLPLVAFGLVLGLWPQRRRKLLALWLFVPPLILFLLSLTAGLNLYVDRFLIICLPAFVVLLARGFNQIQLQWLRSAAIAALLLLTVFAATRIFVDPRLEKQDWRTAIDIVLEGRQPEDLIILYHATSIVPALYYERSADEWALARPGSEDHAWPLIANRTALEPWANLFPTMADDPWAHVLGTSAPRRVWLIYSDPAMSNHAVTMSRSWNIYAEADEATVAWLDAHRGQVLEHHSLAGIEVLLVDLQP